MIVVKKVDEETFKVVVEDVTTTTHTVTVEPEYCKKLTGGKVSTETLIEKSFEFLLQREPNTSILRSFDLAVISRYFPEYESVIKRLLS